MVSDISGIDARHQTVLLELLKASTVRAEVIANNIANQNTPGFRREYVRFEDLLQKALRRGDPIEGLEPRIERDELTAPRADGNNVTPELEVNALRENRLLYDTYMTILRGQYELLRASIESR